MSSRDAPAREIVQVSAGLDATGGGTAVVARLLARATAELAAERGLAFRVLALSARQPPADLAVEEFGGSQRALARAIWRSQLRRRRPQTAALVFDFLGPARAQALLPGRARRPYLLFLHGIEVWRRLSWDRRKAIREAAVVVANSQATRRLAAPFHGRDDVAVLPLALEERAAEGAVDAALLARLGAGFVLIVGRMAASERYKGHDEVLLALAELADVAARLVVVGDGDDRGRLEARAAALGLGGRAEFTGRVSEATLAEIYARAAAFAMPSTGEGFGLVYLEAMRAGRPCIAVRGGAAEEVVVDGETGLLVAAGSVAELAGALRRLLTDAPLARRLGTAGQRREREQFSAAAFGRRCRGHLENLMLRAEAL